MLFFNNSILGTADFYALNHYSSRLVSRGSPSDPNYNPDAEYDSFVDKSWPVSIAPWLIVITRLAFSIYRNILNIKCL